MQQHRPEDADSWPAGPMLPRPHLADQCWEDTVFLHWRIPASAAAPYMPPGVEPDVFAGSTWVGLIGLNMRRTRFGAIVPVPHLGTFPEVNVRLYSRAADGSRGVVFLSLDSPRLPVVLAARAAGVPYVWSRCRSTVTAGPVYGYEVRRYRGQDGSSFTVRPDPSVQADDELSLELTARFAAHQRVIGRTLILPVSHYPWPLHPAELLHLNDGLLSAVGLDVGGPPDSVLFSPGVQARLGRPQPLRTS